MPSLEYWIDSHVALTRWRPLLTDTELWHSFENLKMMIGSHNDSVNLLIMVDTIEMLPPQAQLLARRVGCFDLPNLGRIAVVAPPGQIPDLMRRMRHLTAHPMGFFTAITDALNYLNGLDTAAQSA